MSGRLGLIGRYGRMEAAKCPRIPTKMCIRDRRAARAQHLHPIAWKSLAEIWPIELLAALLLEAGACVLADPLAVTLAQVLDLSLIHIYGPAGTARAAYILRERNMIYRESGLWLWFE